MAAITEITLDHPVESQGVVHRTINIRPPGKEDFRRVRSGHFNGYNRGLAIVAAVTGCSRDVLLKLEPADAKKIESYLSRYMA